MTKLDFMKVCNPVQLGSIIVPSGQVTNVKAPARSHPARSHRPSFATNYNLVKAIAECNQDNDSTMANSLEGDAMPRCSNESSSDDPILEPKHKIFLSHSGAQKEFVEHLCKALEDRWHYPFFDRRPESLPKGERFPELIIQAAQQCDMLIVVLSNEYFMSKWPMIELNAFVKAHQLDPKAKCPKGGPKILPLFYGLSVSELEDEAFQKKWFENWENLVEDDLKKRIVVSDWKYALDVLRSFNGLEYNKQMKEIVAYEDEIVTHVCKSIVPDLKWDDSHVQGKSSICKAIGVKIGSIQVSTKYHIKVVGIYGVGGIGKTTTCKTLSNEMLKEYEGRVCHLEFQSVPSKDSVELLQKVLVDLTRKSKEVIQNLNEGKCKHALRTSLPKQKVFLAIDNVSDNDESIKHAKMFLKAPYHKKSLVIVTTRSKGTLERLGIDGDACVEMPELEEVDAMKLLLHHVACGKEFVDDEDKGHILQCIQRCYFFKGVGLGYHYHPLALEALGLQLGYHGENPLEWVKNLPRIRTFSSLSRANPVFDILRSNFDLLPSSEQNLFMDVGLFERRGRNTSMEEFCVEVSETSSIQWLCDLHKEDEDEIMHRLENLKRKGLLQGVDLRTGEISMHDLYFEFAELEAKGSFNESRDLRKRKWVYVDNGDLTELERTPEGRCWPKLIRLSIAQPYLVTEQPCQIVGQIARLEGIQWDHFSNVEVLDLEGLHWGRGTFNLERLMGLRVLYLSGIVELGSLEGLGKLKNLSQFTWFSMSEDMGTHFVGQLPLSLKLLIMEGGNVVLGSDLLARCHNLSKLCLEWVEARTLDLSNCVSLESVTLERIQKLQTLSGFSASRPSSLQSLVVDECKDLVDIPGMDQLIGLKELRITWCPKLEVPTSLLALTKLQDLELRFSGGAGVQSLVVGAQNSFPRQLRKLCLCSQSMEGLNLDGFNQLEVLDLRWSDRLTSLEGVGDLPALRRLELAGCRHLSRLPDLSNARNLEDLDLSGCYALELHVKDIQMLSELPSLQPVLFSGLDEPGKFRLDFVRRKALIHSCKERHWFPRFGLHWKEHEWDERDLGAPPLQIAKRGPI